VSELLNNLRLTRSRWLGRTALVLLISAGVHLAVVIATGATLEGAVSFRKPITFGISFALFLWSCGWIIDRLAPRPRLEKTIIWTLIVSSLVEVGLITLQAWRGVPSHFNFTTPTDNAIFGLMANAIGVVSVALLALTIWALVKPPKNKPERLAIRAGLGTMWTGLALGSWIISLGVTMALKLGHAPDTVIAGSAGIAKFPHAVALHGLQMFILTVIVSRFGGLDVARQLRATRLAVIGYLTLSVWSIVQTVSGLAPTDLRGVAALVLVAGLAFVVLAGLTVARNWKRPHSSAPTPALDTLSV